MKNALDQALSIIHKANAAIPTAKFDLVMPDGTVIPNVTAFGVTAERIREEGEGGIARNGMGTCVIGTITNLR